MRDVLLVACMKNEGPFILEWIAYYRSIGVTQFIILSNDCNDGTDEMLDRLDQMGIIRHLPNPCMIENYSKSIQTVALKYAAMQREFRAAEWVLLVDADEFLNLMPGDGTIGALLDTVGECDAISFNQVVFGSAGIVSFMDKPVCLQFNRRFEFEGNEPQNNPLMYGIKTLTRNRPDLFSRIPNHRPSVRKDMSGHVRWLDGSGNPVRSEFLNTHNRSYPVYMVRPRGDGGDGAGQRRPRAFSDVGSTHGLGYVNHYSLRSLESFIVQSLRGDAVSAAVRRDIEYWRKYDRNQIEDRSIHRKSTRSQAVLDELLADARLRQLHEEAVATHMQAFRTAAKRPAIAKLIEECREWQLAQDLGNSDDAG